jgi:hypothetical protein
LLLCKQKRQRAKKGLRCLARWQDVGEEGRNSYGILIIELLFNLISFDGWERVLQQQTFVLGISVRRTSCKFNAEPGVFFEPVTITETSWFITEKIWLLILFDKIFVKDGLVYVLKENRGIKRMSDRSLPQHEYQNVEPGVFWKRPCLRLPRR